MTAAGLTTGGTIDASGLASQGVDVAVTQTVAAGLGGTATTALTGSSSNDTFVVTINSAADDNDDATATNLSMGNGIDTVTYSLTAGGTATDILTITSTASTAANADIITGFATGVDFLDYNGRTNGGFTANATATTQTANATLAGGIAAVAASNYIITTDIADSAGGNTSGTAFTALLASTATNLSANYDALEAQLVASGGIFNGAIIGLDAAVASTESALITIDNGTGSVVMRFTNSDATGNTVTAAELDLVAVFTDEVLAVADII